MSVLHVCSSIQSDWKDLLTVDANQNFQWLKFLIILCFITWNYSSQKLDLEHTRAETSNIKTHILPIVMLPHSFQVLLVELNSQTLKTIIMQGYQGFHLYIPWCSKVLSFHMLQMIGLCTSEKSGQGCLEAFSSTLLNIHQSFGNIAAFWNSACLASLQSELDLHVWNIVWSTFTSSDLLWHLAVITKVSWMKMESMSFKRNWSIVLLLSDYFSLHSQKFYFPIYCSYLQVYAIRHTAPLAISCTDMWLTEEHAAVEWQGFVPWNSLDLTFCNKKRISKWQKTLYTNCQCNHIIK